MAGKPDLIAVKGDEALVVDVKTGLLRDSDIQQVLVFMYAAPKAIYHARGKTIVGQISYGATSIDITPEKVYAEFTNRLGQVIRRVADPEPARRVASTNNCRFCKITADDCPDRIEVEVETGYTDDF